MKSEDILLCTEDKFNVVSVLREPDSVKIYIESKQQNCKCPCCSKISKKLHSYYNRTFKDLPMLGNYTTIHLRTRKFYCLTQTCNRKIFTEHFSEHFKPYKRDTNRFRKAAIELVYAVGARPSLRLGKELGIHLNDTTALRLIDKVSLVTPETPRVLGVDDWAFRKGRTYGTLLVDLELRKPIDVLPDREASTLANWLKAHPGIEIITRDRAGAYRSGINQGAPDAVQVTDRWHLLKNLGQALKRMLESYNGELRLAAQDIAASQTKKAAQVLDVASSKEKSETSNFLSKYQVNFQTVKQLRAEGYSIRGIHKRTGVHRQTIKKYLKYTQYPKRISTSKTIHLITPYEHYIQQQWKEEQPNIRQLWREIKQQGFKGSYQSVYEFVRRYPRDPKMQLPTLLKVKAWSTLRVGILLSKDFKTLNKQEQKYLKAFYKHCPKAKDASVLAIRFREITNDLRFELLDNWIKDAVSSDITSLKNFAKGLLNGYDAVKAAVTLKWSNGQVEGQVNRLKTIKRQMYGRAGFELLRKRILADTG